MLREALCVLLPSPEEVCVILLFINAETVESGGGVWQVAFVTKLGVVKPLCGMLIYKDGTVVQCVLESLSNILQHAGTLSSADWPTRLVQCQGWCTAPFSLLAFPPPPPTRSFEIKFPLKFQTGLVKSETFFYNRKLTSIGKVFCLNKTFFTHFNYNFDRIRCFFVTQNGKLFIQNE